MHVGIILDGNRKYARKNKLFPAYKGHIEGKKALKNILNYWGRHKEPRNLTLYAFSLYNLEKRNILEKKFIFHLLEKGFRELLDTEEVFKNKIKILFLGEKEKCSKKLQRLMNEIEEKTKNHDKKTLSFCICYDGQQEIVDAVKKIKGEATKEKIKENIYTRQLPPLDLVIRTGGEKRISGFLLWDVSYSELMFKKETWPEYTVNHFKKDLKEFKERNRRFGK